MTRCTPTTTTKDPEERLLFTFDFTRSLVAGETISTAECTIVPMSSSADATPLATSGSETISGASVTQLLQAGTDGRRYSARMKVTTSTGQILVAAVIVNVETA